MTPQQLAQRLNGCTYGKEMTKAEEAEAKAAGLVVVFGASDDLIEFRGAISAEAGSYDRITVVRIDAKGILPSYESVSSEKAMEDYMARKPGVKKIDAIWNNTDTEYAWTYTTAIPHATFEIVEDQDKYCLGIVFSIPDMEATPA